MGLKRLTTDKAILVCVATHRNTALTEWERSAQLFGWDYKILGTGEQWDGWQTVMRLLRDFCLEEARNNPNTIIIKTDAYDLVMGGGPDELIRKFNNLPEGKTLVIGAERDNVFVPKIEHLRDSGIERCSINCGCLIGRAEELGNMYGEALRVAPVDDQLAFATLINRDPTKFHIDTDQNFVLNLNFSYEISLLKAENGPPPTFRFKESTPVALHTPFVYMDLGQRTNTIRNHVLGGDYEHIHFGEGLIGLLCHLSKHWCNPVYKDTVVPAVVAISSAFVAVVFAFFSQMMIAGAVYLFSAVVLAFFCWYTLKANSFREWSRFYGMSIITIVALSLIFLAFLVLIWAIWLLLVE